MIFRYTIINILRNLLECIYKCRYFLLKTFIECRTLLRLIRDEKGAH